MDLRDLSLDPRTVADLAWHFSREYEAEMGLRSNFAPMAARLECGGRTGGKPIADIDERCLDAAGRDRRIRRALERMGEAERETLRVFALGLGQPELTGLGRASALALATDAARRAWLASRTDRSPAVWLVRLCSRAAKGADARDRLLVAEIRREADARLARAMRAFGGARRGVTRMPCATPHT